MKKLFEYILIALACPLVLPFVDQEKGESKNEDSDRNTGRRI